MGEEEKLQVKKVDSLMEEIIELIAPKKEKFVLGDVEMLVEIYSSIKEDKTLYALAIQKHKSIISALEYILKDEVRLIELQGQINNYDFLDPEIILEVPDIFTGEELILINYLYNLIIGAFIEEKNVTIKLYPKETRKCLQKK